MKNLSSIEINEILTLFPISKQHMDIFRFLDNHETKQLEKDQATVSEINEKCKKIRNYDIV